MQGASCAELRLTTHQEDLTKYLQLIVTRTWVFGYAGDEYFDFVCIFNIAPRSWTEILMPSVGKMIPRFWISVCVRDHGILRIGSSLLGAIKMTGRIAYLRAYIWVLDTRICQYHDIMDNFGSSWTSLLNKFEIFFFWGWKPS